MGQKRVYEVKIKYLEGGGVQFGILREEMSEADRLDYIGKILSKRFYQITEMIVYDVYIDLEEVDVSLPNVIEEADLVKVINTEQIREITIRPLQRK
jgi:hypothetical protein